MASKQRVDRARDARRIVRGRRFAGKAAPRAESRPESRPEAASSKRPKSRYIPALDGIRALAVAAVVLYHLNIKWTQGGMLGVTMFFVISGYIITRLLLKEVGATGRIDFKGFYIRRARRLFPAILTVVLVTIVLCTALNHVMLTKMRPDVLPSLLFFNNWWQILRNVSYFDALGDPSPLTHFWSLAIEEQFYLIWPPLLMALVAIRVPKPAVRRIVLVLAAASCALMATLYQPGADPSRLYYGTDTRAFSLLLGVWLAFIPDRALASPANLLSFVRGHRPVTGSERPFARLPLVGDVRAVDAVGFAGLAGLLLMVRFSNGYTSFQYQGGMLLCSVFTAMLIGACVQPAGPLVRLFSARPLVWLGTRSYSVYLWHYPLLLLLNPVADINETPWWQVVLQLALVLAVAECSYRFIETPCRHGAIGRAWRRVMGAGRAGALAGMRGLVRSHAVPSAVAAVLVVAAAGGLIFVPDTSALSAEGAALLEGSAGASGTETEAGSNSGSGSASNGDAAGGDAQSQKGEELDSKGFPKNAYDVLMIGDSVSLRAVPDFQQTFPQGHLDAKKSRQFSAGIQAFESYVAGNKAGRVVVFALGTNGLVTDELIDKLMADVGGDRVCAFVNTRSPQSWMDATNQAIGRAPQRYGNVRVIDWYGYSEGKNELFDGDGTHLSAEGAKQYVQLIYNSISEELPVRAGDASAQVAPDTAQKAIESLKAGVSGQAAAGGQLKRQ